MIKKILKIILIGAGIFILLIIIGATTIDWPNFFYERDEWSRDMVEKCNGNFQNCIVSVDEVVDFDWDMMYVFEDSVNRMQITEILGFKYNDSDSFAKRKIIFVKNNKIIHEELNFYDPSDGAPNKSTFFEYEYDSPPRYILRDKKNSTFSINLVDRGNKSYYQLNPIKQ